MGMFRTVRIRSVWSRFELFHQWREGSTLLTLPTGECVSTAPMSLNTALLLVMRAAQQTGLESCGTVRSSEG